MLELAARLISKDLPAGVAEARSQKSDAAVSPTDL
jgi:hypothetical protein